MNEDYTAAPQAPARQRPPSQNAALLIDFDNVTMAIRSNLAQELRRLLDSDIIRGKVSIQRAYADWRRYPQYVVPLSEASIDLIFAPAYGSTKKNSTDIRLAIDALEIVFTRPEIGTFILLSGDSDFSSMVLKLKEYGKYVIGVGLQESASDLLMQNCDEYYSYNSLSGLTSVADMKHVSLGPWELCERALERMVQRHDVMRSDRLKQVLVELDPSFDEKAIGFTKFNKYLAEASSRGLITLRKLENGQFEVGVPKKRTTGNGAGVMYAEGPVSDGEAEAPKARRPSRGRARRSGKPAAETGQRARTGSERARAAPAVAAVADVQPSGTAIGLREAYQLLRDAVGSVSRGEEGARDSEVKREILRRRPDFDEAAIGFSKFSRFLKQAHDEEIVNLVKGDEGNYRISPAEDEQEAGKKRRGRRGVRKDRAPVVKAEAPVPDASAADVAMAPEEVVAPEETAAPEKAAEPEEAAGREEAAAPQGRETRPRTRGLGRHRRGARSGGTAQPALKKPVGQAKQREPMEEEPADEPAQVDLDLKATSPSAEPPAKSRRPEGVPTGLGGFRRGRQGGGGAPAQAPRSRAGAHQGAEAPGQKAAPVQPDAFSGGGRSGGGRSGERDAVEHMVGHYKGVGRKTAERLVEELGAGVFDVIDSDPGRIGKILSERRAAAVIAGRAAEREAGE